MDDEKKETVLNVHIGGKYVGRAVNKELERHAAAAHFTFCAAECYGRMAAEAIGKFLNWIGGLKWQEPKQW